MKKHIIGALALATVLSSCSYSQFSGVATGSSLGGMLGSSIGGIIGGPRGSDIGTLVGMFAGGAAGAAVTGNASSERDYDQMVDAGGYYSEYKANKKRRVYAATSPWSYLEVTNVRLVDPNRNQRLDPGEHVFITMDIYNRSDNMMYDIAPVVTCDNRRVIISPTAKVSELASGQGFRYKAEVIAPSRLKTDRVTFTVSFGSKNQCVKAKSFAILTNR